MTDGERLLTGRQLVAQLAELGVGQWTAAAVRRWIHEEDPCPIAQRGMNGQGHRYRLADVVSWLCDRAERAGQRLEAGPAVLDMLARVPVLDPVAGEEPDVSAQSAPGQASAEQDDSTAARATSHGGATVTLTDRVRAAQAAGHDDPELLDILLEVIGGRDPRNWKAAEEAVALRTKRRREEGHLVSDDEMQMCLDTMQAMFLGALNGLRAQLKAELAGIADDIERGRAIDREFDRALERLADSVEREPVAEEAA